MIECSSCHREFPEGSFGVFPESGRPRTRCADCRAENVVRVPTGATKDPNYQRRIMIPRNYGISFEDYEQLRDSQNNLCAACGKAETVTGKNGVVKWLAVDHDRTCCPGPRSCGKCIRGLLCGHCNTGIGKLGDNLEGLLKAVAYLERYESRGV